MVQRMTDPVTNVEIEDVLSSIRRLVSDDARVVKPRPTAVKQPDRLVLTPALRVSSDDADDTPIVSEVEATGPVPEVSKPSESQGEDGAPILLTDLAPLVEEATPEQQGLETTNDFSQNDIEDVSFEHAADVIEAADTEILEEPEDQVSSSPNADDDVALVHEADLDEPEPTDVSDQDHTDTDAVEELTSNLLSQLVEEEVEQALSEVDFDSDDADDVTETLEADKAEPEDDVLDVVSDVLTEEDEAVAALVEEKAEIEPVAEESLESKIAALEELVGRSHEEEWEPEQSEPDAPVFQRSSDVLEWQDHLPETPEGADEMGNLPDADDQPASETAGTDDTDIGTSASDALTIDEETLRGMVSEIVRQELQGALGERITRNVRKLVRREIHRVLMSQDFD